MNLKNEISRLKEHRVETIVFEQYWNGTWKSRLSNLYERFQTIKANLNFKGW